MYLWGLFCLPLKGKQVEPRFGLPGRVIEAQAGHHVELLLRRRCGNGSPRPVTPWAGSALRVDLTFKISLLPSQCFSLKMEKKNGICLEPVSKGPMLTRTRLLNVSLSVAGRDLTDCPQQARLWLCPCARQSLPLCCSRLASDVSRHFS